MTRATWTVALIVACALLTAGCAAKRETVPEQPRVGMTLAAAESAVPAHDNVVVYDFSTVVGANPTYRPTIDDSKWTVIAGCIAKKQGTFAVIRTSAFHGTVVMRARSGAFQSKLVECRAHPLPTKTP